MASDYKTAGLNISYLCCNHKELPTHFKDKHITPSITSGHFTACVTIGHTTPNAINFVCKGGA